MSKPAVLVSACLLGVACNHRGASSPSDATAGLADRHRLIPICPEVAGGLPTPRPAAELQPDGRVRTADGTDVTDHYLRGAAAAVAPATSRAASSMSGRQHAASAARAAAWSRRSRARRSRADRTPASRMVRGMAAGPAAIRTARMATRRAPLVPPLRGALGRRPALLRPLPSTALRASEKAL